MKIRPVKIHTHRENILFLRKDSDFCRAQSGPALEKIEIVHGDRLLVGTLDQVDEGFLEPGEIGLSEFAFRTLGLPAGTEVEVRHPEPIRSVELIRRKIHGEVLGREDYGYIVRDIVRHRYSRVELTAFVVACAQAAMERDEILYLAQAMVDQGEQLTWGREMVVDKHCIGGIPGNRTTMVVVPIVAAYGLCIPKTSSRAITSPSGTADTMEVLCEVDLGLEQMRHIVEKESGCVAWGGAFSLSPADDIIISVERPLNIDASGQMIASILSKKKAAGATHVLVDIPVGPTAKVTSYRQAYHLRKLFEFVGEHMDMALDVIITDGSQPVGRGIGPVLEARDVMQVLRNDPGAPRDFVEKCLDLAGRVIDFHPAVRGGYGRSVAEEILKSGRALDKMERILDAQGRKPPRAAGERVLEAKAPKAGRVAAMDNQKVAKCAKLAGAPTDAGAGVDLLKRVGDAVADGEPLFRIHAEEEADLGYAWDYWLRHPEMIAIE
jgi:thymidine phosphorylase